MPAADRGPSLVQDGVFPVATIHLPAGAGEDDISTLMDTIGNQRRFRYSLIIDRPHHAILVETDHDLSDDEWQALETFLRTTDQVDHVDRAAPVER